MLADPTGSSLRSKVLYNVCFTSQQSERSLRKHRYDTIVEGVGLDRVTRNFDLCFEGSGKGKGEGEGNVSKIFNSKIGVYTPLVHPYTEVESKEREGTRGEGSGWADERAYEVRTIDTAFHIPDQEVRVKVYK